MVTRRFLARPAEVALEAIVLASPCPNARIRRLLVSPNAVRRIAATASARFCDRVRPLAFEPTLSVTCAVGVGVAGRAG